MNKESNCVLSASEVHKSFQSPGGEIKVLQGVDLSIAAGESISISGESGTGKTTLLNILTLLERPDSGHVFWNNTHVDSKRNSVLSRLRGSMMGLIFQGYYLIPELNVIENVLMPRRLQGRVRDEDRHRAESLLQEVGLSKRINHLSTQLSGGEAQRVGIARALMNKPSIVVADEPTGNLDEHTAGGVMDLLLDLCKRENSSVILVTHNPEFATRTNRQVILQNGKIQ